MHNTIDKKRKKIISILETIAFTNVKDLCQWEGSTLILKPKHNIPKKALHAIAEMKESSNGAIQVKLYSKLKAIDLLEKYYSLANSTPTNSQEDSPVDTFMDWLDTHNDSV